jgi:hypothetical protein
MNITVKPAGGLGREAEPGRMTFLSSSEIMQRLRAFSSRLVVVEAGQSQGAGPMTEASGAGVEGVGVEISDALFLGAPDVALAAAPLVAAPVASVRFLFFTIVGRIGGRSKNSGDGTAGLRKKGERGRRAVKREDGKNKFLPFTVIK